MDFVIDKDEIVIQIAEASKHVQASAPPVEDLILDQVQLTAEHTNSNKNCHNYSKFIFKCMEPQVFSQTQE